MSKYRRGLEVDDVARQLEAEKRRASAQDEASRAPLRTRGHLWDAPDPTPEWTLERLRASRVLPGALAVVCHTHGADVGVSCWRGIRGACAERVARRAAVTS